jgi:hypothetical protein
MFSQRRSFTSLRPAALPGLLSLLFIAVAVCTSIATPIAYAQDKAPQDMAPQKAPKPITAELQAAVARAEFLGRQMYLHDRAAWLATDAMLADKRMRKLKEQIGGWLTEPSAHGIRVMFISRDDTPVRLYEVEMDESERLSEATIASAEPLTAEHLAQLRARALTTSQTRMSCARTYNAVSMPSADGIRVYLMPAFSEHGVYPLGGYHLYKTDMRGETLLESRKFSNSCIEHRDSAKGVPKGAKAAYGMFTHLLDPQPTEVHVFVSLYAKVPLMIMTVDNKTMWSVINGKVKLIDTVD